MRILQVLPHLSKGGAERVAVELSNALVDAGHEVTLLLAFPVDPSLNQQFLNKNIQVKFMSAHAGNRSLQYISLPFWVMRRRKSLKSYDAIHCHLTYGLIFGFFVWVLRKTGPKKDLRLIATCHVVGVGISRTRRIINERLSYFFDVFVLMAQDAQWRRFISIKNRKNIQVIANGISASMWENKSKRPNGNSFWTIGTISRLQEERKPWLFLEVFAEIQKLMDCEVHFILGGEGPERDSLTQQSEKLGLKGALSMPGLVLDPKAILNNLDLYVTLNVEEITGIAGLEAVFSGLPVVGIQLSPTYKNGANDWIWSDQDPKNVAQKIIEYLENLNELSAITKEQYKVATEKFSVEYMRDNYLSLYTTQK